MSGALQIGPLSLPWTLLLVFAAIGLAQAVGQQLARRAGLDAEPQLLRMLVVAVVTARLAFVFVYRDAYLDDWLGIIDIRDGGWMPMAGLLAAGLYALHVGIRRRPLRKPLWVAYGSGAALYAAGTMALALSAPTNQLLPGLTLTSLDGQPVVLQKFQGKPVVLNLWATWCPPCRREMPVLAAAQQRHPDVHFVFANQGESAQKVNALLAADRLALRNVLLDVRGEVASHFGHRSLPTTLFFDVRGVLVDVRTGEVSQATLSERLIRLTAPASSVQKTLTP